MHMQRRFHARKLQSILIFGEVCSTGNGNDPGYGMSQGHLNINISSASCLGWVLVYMGAGCVCVTTHTCRRSFAVSRRGIGAWRRTLVMCRQSLRCWALARENHVRSQARTCVRRFCGAVPRILLHNDTDYFHDQTKIGDAFKAVFTETGSDSFENCFPVFVVTVLPLRAIPVRPVLGGVWCRWAIMDVDRAVCDNNYSQELEVQTLNVPAKYAGANATRLLRFLLCVTWSRPPYVRFSMSRTSRFGTVVHLIAATITVNPGDLMGIRPQVGK